MNTKDNKDNKDKKVIDSFNNSINGIIETIKSESHMRFHILIAIVVIILSLMFDINKYELFVLMITISLVFISEIFNTAIEKTVDLITTEYNETAKFIKDAAAGAVMVSTILSLFVGYIIFFDKITKVIITGHQFIKLTGRISNITVLILALLSILVVFIKAITRKMNSKGTALEGGMPSGHATISFSLVTIISYITRNTRVVLLSLLLAILVCQSRIKTGIHTFKEVLVGSFLGFIITYGILQIMYSLGNLY